LSLHNTCTRCAVLSRDLKSAKTRTSVVVSKLLACCIPRHISSRFKSKVLCGVFCDQELELDQVIF